MPAVRRTDARNRDRGMGDVEADPSQGHPAQGCILYLRLRKLREKRRLNAHRENAERAANDP